MVLPLSAFWMAVFLFSEKCLKALNSDAVTFSDGLLSLEKLSCEDKAVSSNLSFIKDKSSLHRFETPLKVVPATFLLEHLWNKEKCFLFHFESSYHLWDSVESVLKTTSMKRPPLYNNHSQVLPSNIWYYLHCTEWPLAPSNQQPLFSSPKYIIHSYITTSIWFICKKYSWNVKSIHEIFIFTNLNI